MRPRNEELENEELRVFLKKSAEQNSHQKNIFRKLLQSGIEIDYRDPAIMRMVSMGVPSQYRPIIWPAIMEDVHGVTLQFYHALINKAAILINASETDVCPERAKIIKHLNSIEQDINRTFPQLKVFTKESEQGQSLFNILSAFTVFRQDLGYLQGMSQIAAFLLLELKQLESFTLLCSLMTTDVLFSFYSMDMEEIQKVENMFGNRLKRGDQQLYHRIKDQQIELRQFLLPWIMTLFTRIMSVDMLSQLWDIILLHGAGTSILLQICFQIIVSSKNKMCNSKNFDDQQFFQALKSVKFTNSQALEIITRIRNSYR